MTLDLARALAIREQSRGAHTTVLLGQVTAVAGTSVTATVAEQTITIPRLRSYATPAAGDIILVLRHGTALYAVGALNAATVVIPPDPDDEVGDTRPPPPTVIRTRTFRPSFTGTWRGRWRGDTPNVIQGGGAAAGRLGRNFGAAYYGNGPSSLNGTAVSGNVRIKRVPGGAFEKYSRIVTLRLLPQKSRPSGKPPSIGSFRGPSLEVGETATVGLPTGWVTRLLNGTAGGIGVGVDADYPHIHLAGRSNWSSAFQITLRFRR